MCRALYWDESVKELRACFKSITVTQGNGSCYRSAEICHPGKRSHGKCWAPSPCKPCKTTLTAAETKPALKLWLHHSVPSPGSRAEVGWWVQEKQELHLAMSTQAHKTAAPCDGFTCSGSLQIWGLGFGTLPRFCWCLWVLQVDVYLLFPGQLKITWICQIWLICAGCGRPEVIPDLPHLLLHWGEKISQLSWKVNT